MMPLFRAPTIAHEPDTERRAKQLEALAQIPEGAIGPPAREVLRRRIRNPELLWRTDVMRLDLATAIYIYTGVGEHFGWCCYTLGEWDSAYAVIAEQYGGTALNA
jgi:hypothetical protein